MTKRSGPRYAILPADAVTDPALSGPDLKVLALLGRHIDKKGWCVRAQPRMAGELSIARGTLQRSLGRLVDAGYVEVEHVKRRDGGQGANRYRVILDDVDRADQLDFFGALETSDEGDHEADAAPRVIPPRLKNEAPPPHLSEAPPASPGRGAHIERPLQETSPSKATLGARTAANDEPATGAVVVALPDLHDLKRQLRATAGEAINTAHPGFITLSEPIAWLTSGCDLALDVLPTIAALCERHTGSPIRSWRYFTVAIQDARERRRALAVSAGPAGPPRPGSDGSRRAPPTPRPNRMFEKLMAKAGRAATPQPPEDPDDGNTIDGIARRL